MTDGMQILWERKWLTKCKYNEKGNDWQNILRKQMIDGMQIWESKWLTEWKYYEKGKGWWKQCILIVSYHCFLGLWCYKDWMSAHSWTRNTRNSSREPKKSWRQTPTRNSLSSGKTSLIYSIANSWTMEGVTSADGQSGGQLVKCCV